MLKEHLLPLRHLTPCSVTISGTMALSLGEAGHGHLSESEIINDSEISQVTSPILNISTIQKVTKNNDKRGGRRHDDVNEKIAEQ